MKKITRELLAIAVVVLGGHFTFAAAEENIDLQTLNPQERQEVSDQWQKWVAQKQAFDERHIPLSEATRYPHNEKDQASLNAAARKGKIACLKWINPSVDYSNTSDSPWNLSGMGTDLVENCNDYARAARATR